MKKIKPIAVILSALITISLLSGCSHVKPSDPTDGAIVNEVTAEEMQQDLNQLVKTLQNGHKNLYFNISKEAFEAKTQELSARLSELTSEQFCYEIMRLTALIGDSHTGAIYPSVRRVNLSVFPFKAERFSDGWHIVAAAVEYSDYLGWRIERVNGIESSAIRDKLSPYIAHDNDTWLDASITNSINNANLLAAAGVITDKTQAVYTVTDGTSSADITIKSVKYGELDSSSLAKCERQVPSTAQAGEYYRYSDEDGILFIQYNQCANAPDKSVKAFTDEVKQKLDGKKAVVVDLRYNGGGNSSLLDDMVGLLADFSGKKFVLIGEDTFSSAILNAYSFKNEANAILVGTPTGGSANHYGELGEDTLCNSGIYVCYSTKYFEHIQGEGIDSAIPDIAVTHEFDDYMSGIDPEMQKVKQLLSE